MANPKVLSIFLTNPRCIYTPGQRIDGYINLELKEETKLKGIKLRYYGAAKVSWSEGGGQHRTYYSNAEKYFDESKYILGKGHTGVETIDQKPGSYKYPFNFQLPPGCPSTFETGKGRVRYHVEAIMERSWKTNMKSSVEFTVSAELDLNTLPHALSAISKNDSKGSCCLCCAAGPARVILNLQKKGYVPGEAILVNAEVTNEGRRPFKAVDAEIVMYAKCRGNACGIFWKIGIDEHVMNAVKHGELARGRTDYFNGERLTVPSMPASGLNGCSIINIEYILRINARVSGIGNIHIPAEIIIGTSPSPQTEASSSGAPAPILPPPSVNNYVYDQTSNATESGNKDLTGYKNTYSDFSQSHGLFETTTTR